MQTLNEILADLPAARAAHFHIVCAIRGRARRYARATLDPAQAWRWYARAQLDVDCEWVSIARRDAVICEWRAPAPEEIAL